MPFDFEKYFENISLGKCKDTTFFMNIGIRILALRAKSSGDPQSPKWVSRSRTYHRCFSTTLFLSTRNVVMSDPPK